MTRITVDFYQILASIDIVPFFIIVTGIIGFWVLMVWMLMIVLKFMDR